MLSSLERNNWIAWIFVIIVGSFIFYISSQSFYGDVGPKNIPLKPVIYHMGIFFLFSLLLMIATSRGKKLDWVYFSVLFGLLYGVSDEIHQLFVPGRVAGLRDVFLDFIGIVFAFLIYRIRFELKNGKNNL